MDAPLIPGLDSFEPITRSSTSFTWRAYQRDLGRYVMVKVLLPDAARNRAQAENFQAVARAVARVKAHSFCQVFDISTVAGQSYVVMEEPVGKTLADLVKESPRMPLRTALRCAIGIAEALGRAWDLEKFVHRNLKPTTISVSSDGAAKMTDFGNAFLARHGFDVAGLDGNMIVGTPNFIAPEQVTHSNAIDHRCDIYALGMVLFYALTGVVPFDGQTPDQVLNSQVSGVLPSPREYRPDLPFSVCLLLESMLMKDPRHRYGSWDEVVVALKHVLDGKPLRRNAHAGAGRSSVTVPAVQSVKRAAGKNSIAVVPSGPGGFLRVLLWLLLLAWLVVYANHRVGDPADFYGRARRRFPRLAPYLPVLSQKPPAAAMAAAAPPPAAIAPALRPLPPPRPRAATPETPPPAPAVQRALANAAAPAPQSAPPPAPPPARNEALERDLAAAYARGGLDALKAEIHSRLVADRENEQLRAMRGIVNSLRPMDELVAQVFTQYEGREMELVYKGKTRRVIPRGVADGRVSLFFGEQNRTIDLGLETLDAAEKIRLLGPRLRPQQALAATLLMLETGDRAAARAHAAAAGPLASVLALIVDRQGP